ncbi:mucin-5AC [Lingula anatina]|uniref:Mucin-5AC n=1 Tax=Lingula anatina TaxID=7574 RepID=A0A1S3HYS8_LINAN|nr:mucin-5AC [Lingula anatina]|eukprot:XP_013390726.1 mucin-5AC [Lingula anatina]
MTRTKLSTLYATLILQLCIFVYSQITEPGLLVVTEDPPGSGNIQGEVTGLPAGYGWILTLKFAQAVESFQSPTHIKIDESVYVIYEDSASSSERAEFTAMLSGPLQDKPVSWLVGQGAGGVFQVFGCGEQGFLLQCPAETEVIITMGTEGIANSSTTTHPNDGRCYHVDGDCNQAIKDVVVETYSPTQVYVGFKPSEMTCQGRQKTSDYVHVTYVCTPPASTTANPESSATTPSGTVALPTTTAPPSSGGSASQPVGWIREPGLLAVTEDPPGSGNIHGEVTGLPAGEGWILTLNFTQEVDTFQSPTGVRLNNVTVALYENPVSSSDRAAFNATLAAPLKGHGAKLTSQGAAGLFQSFGCGDQELLLSCPTGTEVFITMGTEGKADSSVSTHPNAGRCYYANGDCNQAIKNVAVETITLNQQLVTFKPSEMTCGDEQVISDYVHISYICVESSATTSNPDVTGGETATSTAAPTLPTTESTPTTMPTTAVHLTTLPPPVPTAALDPADGPGLLVVTENPPGSGNIQGTVSGLPPSEGWSVTLKFSEAPKDFQSPAYTNSDDSTYILRENPSTPSGQVSFTATVDSPVDDQVVRMVSQSAGGEFQVFGCQENYLLQCPTGTQVVVTKGIEGKPTSTSSPHPNDGRCYHVRGDCQQPMQNVFMMDLTPDQKYVRFQDSRLTCNGQTTRSEYVHITYRCEVPTSPAPSTTTPVAMTTTTTAPSTSTEPPVTTIPTSSPSYSDSVTSTRTVSTTQSTTSTSLPATTQSQTSTTLQPVTTSTMRNNQAQSTLGLSTLGSNLPGTTVETKLPGTTVETKLPGTTVGTKLPRTTDSDDLGVVIQTEPVKITTGSVGVFERSTAGVEEVATSTAGGVFTTQAKNLLATQDDVAASATTPANVNSNVENQRQEQTARNGGLSGHQIAIIGGGAGGILLLIILIILVAVLIRKNQTVRSRRSQFQGPGGVSCMAVSVRNQDSFIQRTMALPVPVENKA